MAYTRVNWEDLPSTNTPRNATNLNKMDAGIKENDDKLNGTKAMGSIVVDDVSGKNLFDWSVGGDVGQYLKNDGTTAYSVDNLRFTDYIKIDATKSNLTISGMTNTLQNPAICFYDSNKTFISGQALGGGLTKTVSIPSTAVYIRCSYRTTNPKTMIEYGTTATEYVEYKQPVKKTSIGVKEDATFYANDFKCKNLLALTNGTYTASGVTAVVLNGTIKLNGTPDASLSHITIPLLTNVDLKSNTNYTLSSNNNSAIGTSSSTGLIRLRASEDDTTTDVGFDVANNSLTFTKNENKTYTGLKIRTASGVTYNNFVIKPQLEVGSEATSYTEYKNFDATIKMFQINGTTSSNGNINTSLDKNSTVVLCANLNSNNAIATFYAYSNNNNWTLHCSQVASGQALANTEISGIIFYLEL